MWHCILSSFVFKNSNISSINNSVRVVAIILTPMIPIKIPINLRFCKAWIKIARTTQAFFLSHSSVFHTTTRIFRIGKIKHCCSTTFRIFLCTFKGCTANNIKVTSHIVLKSSTKMLEILLIYSRVSFCN